MDPLIQSLINNPDDVTFAEDFALYEFGSEKVPLCEPCKDITVEFSIQVRYSDKECILTINWDGEEKVFEPLGGLEDLKMQDVIGWCHSESYKLAVAALDIKKAA